jgi:hypothetical protein
MNPMVHECKNVCRTTFPIIILCLTNPSLSRKLVESKGTLFPMVRRVMHRRIRNAMDRQLVSMEGKQWRLQLNDMEDQDRPPGLDCYCHKQMALWSSLADQAETQFTNVLGRPLY